MNPSNRIIDATLAQIERTELPDDHPRRLAQRAVVAHRKSSSMLTQTMIDSSDDTDARRRRFVQSSVKWSRRSILARLFRR